MAGYQGYSMSNNAAQARQEGRLPLTAAIALKHGIPAHAAVGLLS